MSSISSSESSQLSQPIRILIADRNSMGSQLLAVSLDRDPRFEAVGVNFAPVPTDILNAIGERKPDVVVISADFDGGTKSGLEVARALSSHGRTVNLVLLLEIT